MPGARLACLNVMQTSLIAIDENVDAAGDNIHVQRIAELRRWAEPLQLPRGKITYHLVESRSVAAGSSTLPGRTRWTIWSSALPVGGPAASKLTAQIIAEAPCTVTVVRLSGGERQAASDAAGAPAQRSIQRGQ